MSTIKDIFDKICNRVPPEQQYSEYKSTQNNQITDAYTYQELYDFLNDFQKRAKFADILANKYGHGSDEHFEFMQDFMTLLKSI